MSSSWTSRGASSNDAVATNSTRHDVVREIRTPLLGEDGNYCEVSVIEEGPEISVAGAGFGASTFNVINIFMGVGLLSMAYAMRLSGWFGLLPLIICCLVFCLSAILLSKGLEDIPKGQAQTYPALGRHVWGEAGARVVTALAMVEFLGNSCLLIIVIWKQLELMIEEVHGHGDADGFLEAGEVAETPFWSPHRQGCLSGTLLLLPLVYAGSFQLLSYFSALSFFCTLLITLAVAVAVAMDPDRNHMPHQPPAGHSLFSWGLPQAVGIFAVSVSNHSTLPAVRNSMANPKQFAPVIYTSFLAMAFVYLGMSCAGYYYFGNNASPLVTTDLSRNSVLSGRSLWLPWLTVGQLVDFFIAINAFTTLPLMLLAMQDLILSAIPSVASSSHFRRPRPILMGLMRILLLAMVALPSYLASRSLGNVESMVGGVCSMCCSLLMPSMFYLRLKWSRISWSKRIGVVSVLVLGMVMVVVITGQNIWDLVERVRSTSVPATPTALQTPPGPSGTSNTVLSTEAASCAPQSLWEIWAQG